MVVKNSEYSRTISQPCHHILLIHLNIPRHNFQYQHSTAELLPRPRMVLFPKTSMLYLLNPGLFLVLTYLDFNPQLYFLASV